MRHYAIVPLLLAASLANPLAAQEEPAEDALSGIRDRNSVSEEDAVKVRSFVTENIDALLGDDPLASQNAVENLRTAYDGSDAFKKAYATACLEAANNAYRRADLVPATRLITLVNIFDALEAQPLYTEALQDARVGVRAAAAIGLDRLREKLAAAGADAYGRAIDALAAAGRRERSTATLRAIYAAMDYGAIANTPEPKRAALAVLGLLEDRARQYESGEVHAIGADDLGIRVAGRMLQQLNADERKRLTGAIARMTRHAIERYTTGRKKLADVRNTAGSRELQDYRNAVERLIIIGEESLNTLLSPKDDPPDVVEAMRQLNVIDMKNEWNRWSALLKEAVGEGFTLTERPEPEEQAGDAEGT